MRTKLRTITMTLLALAALSLACDSHWHDHDPPPVPAGVYSITGDSYIEVLWSPVHVDDLAGYQVYRSRHSAGEYHYIGASNDESFIDTDVDNGNTYFYAVTAYDDDDNESELSYEDVFDTPRPSGRNLTVYDEDEFAGVDFSDYREGMIQEWDALSTDMYLLWLNERYCFASRDVVIGDTVYGTDMQHAGVVSSLDDIGWAPDNGWTEESADTLVLFEDNAYIVWTWDNHFAKFMVVEIGYDYVVIDWAYQTDEGNPELAVVPIIRSDAQASIKSPRPTNGERASSAPAERSGRN